MAASRSSRSIPIRVLCCTALAAASAGEGDCRRDATMARFLARMATGWMAIFLTRHLRRLPAKSRIQHWKQLPGRGLLRRLARQPGQLRLHSRGWRRDSLSARFRSRRRCFGCRAAHCYGEIGSESVMQDHTSNPQGFFSQNLSPQPGLHAINSDHNLLYLNSGDKIQGK